ncbi:hypothetical protein [Thermodesulfatator autotrophicus]|uniref:Uncharacterized protein n=1 Tax=Thermodesulfatator autotrophicus TaxID=1795632 RepID=A0A177E826_9BACT|nr:hypothetical protein [Thermodesulfatator autotrophicus]OAG28107.1 hypothetical protein TH606_03480 [Thermodesulfatator autotrophicus]
MNQIMNKIESKSYTHAYLSMEAFLYYGVSPQGGVVAVVILNFLGITRGRDCFATSWLAKPQYDEVGNVARNGG